MRAITVLLDPDSPDFTLTVELSVPDATIGHVKDEICKQDVIGTMTPSCIRLYSVQQPSVALSDATPVTEALGTLVLRSATSEDEGEGLGQQSPVSCSGQPSQDLRHQEIAREGEATEASMGKQVSARAEEMALEENGRRARLANGLKPCVRSCWQKAWDQGRPAEYTFEMEDPNWVKYLKRHGFCVLADVLPKADREEMLDCFWAEMSQVVPGLRRDDPSTWDFPGNESTGIARGYGLPQGDFAWAVRSHPQIKRAFELIYRTDQLVVSMDSLKLVGRGVTSPGDFWLHRDQLKDVPAYSVQSIYSFFEVGPLNDGTILIPGSHREFHPWDEWQRSARGAIIPMLRASGRQQNNVRLPEEFQEGFMSRALKPRVPENGLILFCSRTIHASSPDAGTRWLRERQTQAAQPLRPNRIAASVSMCPRGRRGGKTLLHKMTLLRSQSSTTHWADDEVLYGKSWGRDGDGRADFRMLPAPRLELDRQRFELL